MRDDDRDSKDQPPGDRRAFLRRFWRKGAPLVVGAVAKPLSKLPGITPPTTRPGVGDPAARAAAEAESISDQLKREFEETHEEFIKNNPDFFEKP
jgi:hypothetical protein